MYSWSYFLLQIALFLCFFQRQTPKMENKMKPPIPTETYTAAPVPGRRTCTIQSNAGQIMRRKKRKNGFKEAEKTPNRKKICSRIRSCDRKGRILFQHTFFDCLSNHIVSGPASPNVFVPCSWSRWRSFHRRLHTKMHIWHWK